MITPQQVDAGQAVYSPTVLRNYDWMVLGLSNHLLWRCPTAELRRLYDRNVSDRHLDVGVGTGYFLDKAKWPVATPEITLVDLIQNCLTAAAKRIRRFAPQTIAANILEPLPRMKPYRSASLCYLLHYVPGVISDKAIVFDHVSALLASGARVFGATIVQGTLRRSRIAQAFMDLYNRRGIFSNVGDTLEDLDAALRKRFRDVKVESRGTVALFEANAALKRTWNRTARADCANRTPLTCAETIRPAPPLDHQGKGAAQIGENHPRPDRRHWGVPPKRDLCLDRTTHWMTGPKTALVPDWDRIVPRGGPPPNGWVRLRLRYPAMLQCFNASFLHSFNASMLHCFMSLDTIN
jgi:hypothetical protein